MRCPNCGTNLNENSKFCNECGTQIQNAPAEIAETVEEVCVKSSKNKIILIFFISLFVIFILIAGKAYLNNVLFNENSESADNMADIEYQTEASQEIYIDPPSSNSYGIYVTGNTELARMAGDTLIEKAAWCGWDDYSYGYVLKNGHTDSEGLFSSYSDISVSVNEDPYFPYTGQIVLQATRYTSGKYYPLQVIVDWEATDYGDYYNFTWTNTQING